MKPIIHIINGPNLNLLGTREPSLYGTETLNDINSSCKEIAEKNNHELIFKQSNHEGEIVDFIHQAIDNSQGIIINPAAYSHTSIAILDALKSYEGFVIEVHISNIHKRENFRHHSYISQRADAVIAGCGTQGYSLALKRLFTLIKN